MPNWTNSSVTIKKADNQDFEEVVDLLFNEEGHLTMNKAVPMPKELESTSAPSDQPNWYDWRVSHWGTKWDFCDADVDRSSEELIASFNTAWAFPLEFFLTFSKEYNVTLFYTFTDEGEAVSYSGVISNGEVTDESASLDRELCEAFELPEDEIEELQAKVDHFNECKPNC